MLLNTLLTTVLSSSKTMHQCVWPAGALSPWGALPLQRRPTASFLSANQHVMFMRRSCGCAAVATWQLFGTSGLGCWLSWYTSDRDTVFYIKANSADCPLSYRQHVVRCRCIQNSIQSNCCSAKLSTSFLLSYDPVTVLLLLGVDYTL